MLDSFASLEQPVELRFGLGEGRPPFQGEQLRFDVGFPAADFRLEFDLIIHTLSVPRPGSNTTGFSVFWSRSTSNAVRFSPSGQIVALREGDLIGTYAFDTLMRVMVVVGAEKTTFLVNGEPLVTLPRRFTNDFIRLGVSDSSDRLSAVYLDNVLITTIPEPRTGALVLLGLIILALNRWQRRCPAGRGIMLLS